MLLTRDQTFRVVFNLRTPVIIAGQPQELVGSGIFVVKNNTEVYIVTATHVATTCNNNTEVVLSDITGQSTALQLIDFDQNIAWQNHPVADISVLQIQMTPAIQSHLENRFFPYDEDHFHLQQTPVSRDVELTSVGFPSGLGSAGMFSPLTFRSYASSSIITLNRFDTNTPCEFFILEDPGMGGYSGCPVFDLGIMITGGMTTRKQYTVCHGIMHGIITDATGGKLATVSPSYFLNDML